MNFLQLGLFGAHKPVLIWIEGSKKLCSTYELIRCNATLYKHSVMQETKCQKYHAVMNDLVSI